LRTRRILLAAFLVVGIAGIAIWRLTAAGAVDDPLVPSGWDLAPPPEGAVPVAATARMAGMYPAGSRIKDDKAPGGFGPCDNWPKNLGDKTWGDAGKIALVAFPDEPVGYFKHQGVGVRLINRSAKRAAFAASDSCIYLLQEARDEKGVWREIETSPGASAFCGNSFHRVFLEPNQYWEFKGRRYAGPMKTKIRFRLDLGGENDDGASIVSNEFDGAIAPAQLRRAPGRAGVRHALSSEAPNAEALATLTELIDSKVDDGDRHSMLASAAWKLGQFGAASKNALPTLRTAMSGANPSLRVAAAEAVWRITGEPGPTVKTLIAVLEGPDEGSARLEAIRAFVALGPAAKEGVPALCRALPTGDERFRREVAEALGAIRQRPDLCVPALAKRLDDPDWFARSTAVAALGDFGPDAKSALPELVTTLRSPDVFVRLAAARAIYRIDGKIEPGLPIFIAELGKEAKLSEASPAGAAEELAKIGPAAAGAVPALTKALGSADRDLRVYAAVALWRVTNKAEPALQTLIRAVREAQVPIDSDTNRAYETLGDMGPAARAAVPALVALRNRESTWKGDIDKAIKKIDPAAK
jgi:HEAT repeat protein